MNCWDCICQYNRQRSQHTGSWTTAKHGVAGCRYSIFFSRACRKRRGFGHRDSVQWQRRKCLAEDKPREQWLVALWAVQRWESSSHWAVSRKEGPCSFAPIFCPLPMHGTALAVLEMMGVGTRLGCSSTNHSTCALGFVFPVEQLLSLRWF